IASALAAIAALVLWTPLLSLFEITLGYDLPLVEALVVALILLPCAGFLTGDDNRRWPALASGVLLLASLIGAALAPNFSERAPRALNITYAQNQDAHEARIVAGSAHFALPPNLAPRFAPAQVFPWDERRSWSAEAAFQNLPAADAVLVSDTTAG